MASELSGHLEGTTFQKTRYGLCAQTKVVQKFRRTEKQSYIRQSFLQNAGAWRGLTQAQRATWVNAAGSLDAAYSLFQSRNQWRKAFGYPILNQYVQPLDMVTPTFKSQDVIWQAGFQRYRFDAQFYVNPDVTSNQASLFQRSQIIISTGQSPNIRESSEKFLKFVAHHTGYFDTSFYNISTPTGQIGDIPIPPNTKVSVWQILIDRQAGAPLCDYIRFDFVTPEHS